MRQLLERVQQHLNENTAVEAEDIQVLVDKHERLLDALLTVEDVCVHSEQLQKHLNTEMEEKLHSAIIACYRTAHVAREPSCMNVHDDWEDEFQRQRKKL